MKMSKTDVRLEEAQLKFNHKFTETFVNKSMKSEVESSFLQSDTTDKWTQIQRDTAKYALSNMLGSVAYMYGDRMIYQDGKVVKQEPTSLFTGIPDRPDHGRGFMWDEGFHQHLISVWNMDLTQQIIASWFATTDQETGWICREQMLGREIRSGAPPTSWPQSSSAANPPSQHLLIDNLLNRFEADADLKAQHWDSFKLFLAEIYDNFKKHVDWYQRTQASEVRPNSFRWEGRTLTYCLTSGMDDYPRAPFLTTEEAHLDL